MTYEMRPTQARCPACECTDGRVQYTVTSSEAAQHYVLNEVHPERYRALVQAIERLWGQPTCDVVQCETCGFCFAHPYVAGDAEFYTLAYERTGYPVDKWEFRRTQTALAELRPELGDAPTLLEVGAGNGAFIRRVVPGVFAASDVLCTEFSAYGKREIERLGVACIDADVRDLPLSEWAGRFDVACMFQVLEHLDRLDELFEHLSALGRPTAHLFVAVPNEARIAFNEHNGSLLDMPPNHVGRWNRTSLDTIGQRHGWSLAEHDVEPAHPRADAVEFATYRYMRGRQTPGSVPNRIEQISSAGVRKPLQALAAGVYAVASLPTIATLVRTPGLGGSQWAHFTRTPG